MDEIIQVKSDKEVTQTLKDMGRKIIPRLERGSNIQKRSGKILEIDGLVFDRFRLRTCPDCKEAEKFIIFKFVAVCMKCNEFYYIVR